MVTVFDGFALAKQGKAGTALGIAAIGSFVGATISIIGLTLLAPVVAEIALDFGPPEYAALALLGVLLVATIGSGNKLKALIAGAVGLLLATVGRDSFSGASRFTFDSLQLADGIDFVVVAMGLFGVGEILYNLEQRHGKTHVPGQGRQRVAVAQGPAAVLGRDRARLAHRFRAGRAARRWRGAVVDRGLRHREAAVQDPRAVRPRRRRGRRRPGDRQQRGGHLVVHPAADHRPARPTRRWRCCSARC